MAISMSNNQLNYARKKFYGNFYITKTNLSFADKLINKILIGVYLFKFTLVNFKRRIYRIIYTQFNKKSDQKIINFSINLDKKSIEEISNNLKSNNFTFVENFLSEESYKYLINSWPNIN